MEENAVVPVQKFENHVMTVNSVVAMTGMVKEVMQTVMKINEHYGTIPGVKKPSLWKPGAEKLLLAFRLAPSYEIVKHIAEPAFISYMVRCDLHHQSSGLMGAGLGSCNSRETKYRYRSTETSTGQTVPRNYWDLKKSGDNKQAQALLGGKDFKAIKDETGAWVIAESKKVENDNPWDLDNTLLKMACKRALIAAVLNVTAASDVFTQDLEDLKANGYERVDDKPEKPPFDPMEQAGEKDLAAFADGKAALEEAGNLEELGDIWKKLSGTQRRLLGGVKDAMKVSFEGPVEI